AARTPPGRHGVVSALRCNVCATLTRAQPCPRSAPGHAFSPVLGTPDISSGTHLHTSALTSSYHGSTVSTDRVHLSLRLAANCMSTNRARHPQLPHAGAPSTTGVRPGRMAYAAPTQRLS